MCAATRDPEIGEERRLMSVQIDTTKQAMGELRLATKNVLLVTCIDLRLLDEVVAFMDGENLTNRYDQFVSAGSSLTLYRPGANEPDPFAHCRHAFYDHLELAVALHEIKYVYIIDHMDCGAYKYASPYADKYGKDATKDAGFHKTIVNRFAQDVAEYAKRKRDALPAPPADGKPRRGESSAAAGRSKEKRSGPGYPYPDLRGGDAGASKGKGKRPYRRPVSEEDIEGFDRLIHTIYKDRYLRPPYKKDWELKVYGFLMDLRGLVCPL